MHIRYDAYPDDPEATRNSRAKAYHGFFWETMLGLSSFGAVTYFIFAAISLFSKGTGTPFLKSICLLILVACIDFFILTSGCPKQEKAHIIKQFFVLLTGGILSVTGVIGMIMGLLSLCRGRSGPLLLVFSTLAVLIIIFITWLAWKKVTDPNYKVRLFAESDAIQRLLDAAEASDVQDICYCHKCGEKLLPDSVFCAKCGAKTKN